MEFRFFRELPPFFTLSNNDSMIGLKQEIIEKSGSNDTLDEEKYESIDEDDS
jgi:hypothetical protein